MIARLAAVLLCCGLVVACGEDVQKPAVQPLGASAESLGGLYKWGRGPWQLSELRDARVPHSTREGDLQYHLFYPKDYEGAVPVLLFSHGNWSDNASYDPLLEHWVSHGYAVIAPLHMDGSGGYAKGALNMIRYGNLGLIQARVDDLLTLLDQLEAIEAAMPEGAPQLDATRIAATGHSFGAFNAQQLGGARAWDEETGAYVPADDPRIRAVVALSPPGPMFDEITEGSWTEQNLPTLVATGTWDSNAIFWPDWKMHLMSWETARPGNQYALVVQGADHYLGNLICRPELEEPPQRDALNMYNTAVIAFLDAYLKQEPAAVEFLNSSRMQSITDSFAVLETR